MDATNIAAVAAALIAIIGALWKGLLDKYKGDSKAQLDNNTQALMVYKELIDRLNNEVQRLESKVDDLINRESLCREKYVVAETKISQLELETNKLAFEIKLRDSYSNMLMDSVSEAIVVINEDSIILSWSSAASRLLGWLPNEVVGRNLETILPQYIKNEHKKYIDNYLLTKIKKVIGVGRCIDVYTKNGDEIKVNLSVGETNIIGTNKKIFTAIMTEVL